MAAVASYVRNNFGNIGVVRHAGRRRARARRDGHAQDAVDRARNRERRCRCSCRPIRPGSHGESQRRGRRSRADHQGWTSVQPPAAGMWLQVELPQATRISEVQFNAPGGGRGNPAPGAGPAPAPPAAGQTPTPASVVVFREFQVQTSIDGKTWSQPIAQGTVSTAPMRRSRRIREVRADHADGGRRGPWTAADPERPRAPAGGVIPMGLPLEPGAARATTF